MLYSLTAVELYKHDKAEMERDRQDSKPEKGGDKKPMFRFKGVD